MLTEDSIAWSVFGVCQIRDPEYLQKQVGVPTPPGDGTFGILKEMWRKSLGHCYYGPPGLTQPFSRKKVSKQIMAIEIYIYTYTY